MAATAAAAAAGNGQKAATFLLRMLANSALTGPMMPFERVACSEAGALTAAASAWQRQQQRRHTQSRPLWVALLYGTPVGCYRNSNNSNDRGSKMKGNTLPWRQQTYDAKRLQSVANQLTE